VDGDTPDCAEIHTFSCFLTWGVSGATPIVSAAKGLASICRTVVSLAPILMCTLGAGMTGPSFQNAAESTRKAAAPAEQPLVYEPNPKHKEPWQRGARGSRCPREADGPALLAASEVDPKRPGRRYATDGDQAYCGQEHLPGRWHGYPVKWREVPPVIWRQWVRDKRVSRRALKEHW